MHTYLYTKVPAAQRDERLVARLTRLWDASVRASHHFLGDADTERLKPYVAEALNGIHILYVAYAGEEPAAFMGIANRKIEMLFVAPAHFGRGIGSHLVRLALNAHHARFVDANEQNTRAVAFYRHLGFVPFERSPLDDQGNPFPILRMERRGEDSK